MASACGIELNPELDGGNACSKGESIYQRQAVAADRPVVSSGFCGRGLFSS